MTHDEIKQRLQDHFTDGLVTIVGSGLACAEGIPGMGQLRDFLLAQVPARIDKSSVKDWEIIAEQLKAGMDLESALLKHAPTSDLEAIIVGTTAELILSNETNVLEEVFSGKRVLRLSRLFPHLLKPPTGIPFVTTNYDRLIEVAAEVAGLGVDTQFTGTSYGRLNAKDSRMSFCRNVKQTKGKVFLSYTERITLSKPHGSLDWFQHNGDPVRCPFPMRLPRLIITPGRNKFRTGYDRPFDSQRERANRDIDRAARLLILGYGFNDDHLETHLSPRIRDGTPTLILTHTLSAKGQALLKSSPSSIALIADTTTSKAGAVVVTRDKSVRYDGANIWDLGEFISEVLEP